MSCSIFTRCQVFIISVSPLTRPVGLYLLLLRKITAPLLCTSIRMVVMENVLHEAVSGCHSTNNYSCLVKSDR